MPLRLVSVRPSSSASLGPCRRSLTRSSTPEMETAPGTSRSVAVELSAVVALDRVRTAVVDSAADSAADSSFVVDSTVGLRALEAGFGSCSRDGCVSSSSFFDFFFLQRQRQGQRPKRGLLICERMDERSICRFIDYIDGWLRGFLTDVKGKKNGWVFERVTDRLIDEELMHGKEADRPYCLHWSKERSLD